MIKKRNKNNNSVISKVDNAHKKIEKEILLNVPNSITLLRLVLSFVFIYMLFENYSKLALVTVFFFAAITDWFDGYFARKLKQTSKFGARMDQVVDRIFTIMIVLALIVYLIMYRTNPSLSIFTLSSNNIYLLLFLSCSREIIGTPGVVIAIFRKKDTYCVKYIGKLTTFLQSMTIGAIIIEFPFVLFCAIATCIIGIISGFDYLKYSLN